MLLKHGDLLKVYGQGIVFRLLLDMRAIDPSLPAVRTMPNFSKKGEIVARRNPEEDLRRKIKALRSRAAEIREKALLVEEKQAEVQARRKLRSMGLEEKLKQALCFYEKRKRRLA